MWGLVNLQGISRRALMIIAGGTTMWDQWLQNGATPALYARVSRIEASERPSGHGDVRDAPYEFFPGGFAYPQDFHAAPGQRT